MDVNPYESPRETSEGRVRRPSNRNIFGLRKKPWWGYGITLIVGAFLGGLVLTPPLASIDDAGGTQMIIGGFLGVVIYGLLFPLSDGSTETNP